MAFSGFDDSFGWQARFKPFYIQVIRMFARVDEGTWEDDVYRATDMLMYSTPQLAFACRARTHGYKERYGAQFTIRSRRPSGVPTELAKIKRGFGDFMIYGFEAEPHAHRLNPWLLINLPLLREYLDNGGRWYERTNKPEHENDRPSSFAVFDVDEVAQVLGLIHNAGGITVSPWPTPAGKCRACGHDSWQADETGPIHECCGRILPSFDCLACAQSAALQRTHFGWPHDI
jgi:hypothetical protein